MFNFTPIDMSTEKIYTYMLKKCENNFLCGAYTFVNCMQEYFCILMQYKIRVQ